MVDFGQSQKMVLGQFKQLDADGSGSPFNMQGSRGLVWSLSDVGRGEVLGRRCTSRGNHFGRCRSVQDGLGHFPEQSKADEGWAKTE